MYKKKRDRWVVGSLSVMLRIDILFLWAEVMLKMPKKGYEPLKDLWMSMDLFE